MRWVDQQGLEAILGERAAALGIDGLMSGLSTRYDLGAERAEVGRLIGDRADARTSLFAEMADGDGILLDAFPDGRAAGLAVGFTRVRCVPAEAGPSMLIRPDGCIAWAGDEGDVAGFVDALERWFARAAPQPGGMEERSRSEQRP